jgi:hypothetical protein
MNPTRFDTIAKLFASRRLSRRQALAQGGSGIAAGTLTAVRMTSDTEAQDATPATPATPAADGEQGPTMLFLQAFQSGGVTPAEGAEGRYTLTLEGGLGHTVYFSDRPDRIVGAHPTPQFLEGLGFPEDNPPNAALVVETGPGETQIAVVELFAPHYDEATHTATYEVEVLGEWERAGDISFVESDADLAEVLPEFGAAHLFIDDCVTGRVWCAKASDGADLGTVYEGGHCYAWRSATCLPCRPWYDTADYAVLYWDSICATQFAYVDSKAHGVCTSGALCDPA